MYSRRVSNKKFSTVAKNYMNGKWVQSNGSIFHKSMNPATQEVVREVPQTTKEEFDKIVANSKETFKSWKEVPIASRVR